MTENGGSGLTALFLSPHLDDVAFSCGGTVAALRRDGWRVVVATVFTASVEHPTGFALACQLDKGLGAEVDYLALRRAEDEVFGKTMGVSELLWLGLREAPHRGYTSAAELFAPIRPEDDISSELGAVIDPVVERFRPGLILAPQGIGGHVDHRQVVRLLRDRPQWHDRLVWYRDLPYSEKYPDAPADVELPAGLVEIPVRLGPRELEAKLNGCAAYASQVPFQFGSAPAMRHRLSTFAAREAKRAGFTGHAEVFLAPAQSAALALADVQFADTPS